MSTNHRTKKKGPPKIKNYAHSDIYVCNIFTIIFILTRAKVNSKKRKGNMIYSKELKLTAFIRHSNVLKSSTTTKYQIPLKTPIHSSNKPAPLPAIPQYINAFSCWANMIFYFWKLIIFFCLLKWIDKIGTVNNNFNMMEIIYYLVSFMVPLITNYKYRLGNLWIWRRSNLFLRGKINQNPSLLTITIF